MASRLATPGRNPSRTMRASRTSRCTTSRAAGFFRSMAMLRLFRFSVSNCTGTYERPGSPLSISTFVTSAPRSASIAEANGPGTNIEKSTTRIPRRGSQGSARSLKIRRRVNHQHLHALTRDSEDVHDAGRKEARLPRLHLELFLADLDVRAAFQQVAHLLDARVQMGVGALAALDFADQHLDLFRTHDLGSDEAEVLGAG